MLEFAALAVLRFTQPNMQRPFKVPGGNTWALLLGVCPLLMLGFALVKSKDEQILGISALLFGALLMLLGLPAYAASGLFTERPARADAK